MKSSTETVKRLKGDGLQVTMDLNDLNLKVSGDGCRVTVERNCGRIRVYGDGCSLKVNCNDGDIEYKGDGGSIILGGGSRTESVSYVGDGGRISVKNSAAKTGAHSSRVKRSTKQNSDSISSNKEEVKSLYRSSLSDSELEVKLDNLSNERKEKRAEKSCSNGGEELKDRNLRRSKTIVVTKITSEHTPVNINCRNGLIKNWFRSPPTVVNGSCKSGPESL